MKKIWWWTIGIIIVLFIAWWYSVEAMNRYGCETVYFDPQLNEYQTNIDDKWKDRLIKLPFKAVIPFYPGRIDPGGPDCYRGFEI